MGTVSIVFKVVSVHVGIGTNMHEYLVSSEYLGAGRHDGILSSVTLRMYSQVSVAIK